MVFYPWHLHMNRPQKEAFDDWLPLLTLYTGGLLYINSYFFLNLYFKAM